MEVERYKYFGVYPSNLFECYNAEYNMHFILSLKHTSSEETEKFLEILRYCGANVSRDLKDADGFTAIIADHNDKVNFSGPVFTLNYLKDCLELRKLQDISKYRQNASNDIFISSSCMSVVYFRFCSWDSVISSFVDNCTQRVENTSEDSDVETYIEMPVVEEATSSLLSSRNTITSGDKCSKAEPNTPDATSSPVSLRSESKYFPEDRKIKTKDDTTNKTRKNTRRPYSYEEKCDILKYIVQHYEYSRVRGMKLWTIMERRKVCPSRTWQSMKEHFLRVILPDLNCFTFLTESQRKQLSCA